MTAFDYNLMFLSSGNLTKTVTVPTSGIKIKGTPQKGLGVRITFPTTDGTYMTVYPSVVMSEDDSTYRTVAYYPGGAQSWASGGKDLVFGFKVPERKYKYVKLTLTVAGQTSSGSFGAVKAGIVLSAGEYDRTVDWS